MTIYQRRPAPARPLPAAWEPDATARAVIETYRRGEFDPGLLERYLWWEGVCEAAVGEWPPGRGWRRCGPQAENRPPGL